MFLKKILFVSGTHGNEINPVWAINQFKNRFKDSDHSISYKYTIGNPKAFENGSRYVDCDLNRSFNIKKNNQNLYEVNRADFLKGKYGINSREECHIAIDLHTTTANMGTSIVMYGRRNQDFCLAALLQNKFGLPIYLHEKDINQTGFLVEAWPCGIVIEIGSVAQNFYDQKTIDKFLIIISSIRKEIHKLISKQIKLPQQITIHVHKGSVDYPRNKTGEIVSLIHPERLLKDWKPIKKGDPLFLSLNGETISYENEEIIWPVFIGEVAYKEKNIAFSYTKKELINSSEEWVLDFLSR